MSGTAIGEFIEIDRLICPLRYDIWVRIEFIKLLRDEWMLYQRDFAAFLKRPAAEAYYSWFTNVLCARQNTSLLHDPAKLQAAFLKRVQQTAELWRSVVEVGFDISTPIRLRSGRSLRSINGKPVKATIFAGDGCHRISCLHVLGAKHLEPVEYEVAVRRRFRPLDNTALLIDAGTLDRGTYLRFISRFYCDGAQYDSEQAIVRHVNARHPETVNELTAVLAYDLARLASHGG